MQALRISTVYLAASAAMIMACGRDIVSPATTGAHRPEFAKGAGGAKPYLVTFAGDISASFVRLLNPMDPLGSVSLDGATLSFVNSGVGGTTTAGDIAVCRATGLAIDSLSWSGYAGASWTEGPDPSFHSKLTARGGLGFVGVQNDANGGWINLKTQNPADATTSLNGVVTSYYRDDYALIGVGSWHTDPNQPDPADRCISFTVKAEPQ